MPKGGKAPGKPSGSESGHANWSRRNFAPVLFISIDEKGTFKDADDLYGKITSFKVKEGLTKATETTIVFRNDDMKLAEDPRFLANTVWKFRFGFYKDMSPIYVAVLRNLEPSYADKVTMTVTLYDYSLNASQTSSAKNWGKIKSSEIAKKIAKNHKMIPAVEDSNDTPKKAWIQPSDLNDIQFLRDLAALNDFEVYVEGDPPTLIFRKKPYDAIPKAVLTYYKNPSEFSYLKSFKPKSKSLGPYSSGVKGTDAEKGKGAKGTSSDSSKGSQGLADKSNYEVAVGRERGDGTTAQSAEVVVKPIATATPANTNTKKLAEVKRSQVLDKANEASSDHPLTPSIAKGKIFEIAGVEKPLAGKWYVQEVTHEISGTSCATKGDWKRNSTNGKGGAAVSNKNNKGAGAGANNAPIVQIGRERGDGTGAQSQEVIRPNQPVPASQGAPQPVAK